MIKFLYEGPSFFSEGSIGFWLQFWTQTCTFLDVLRPPVLYIEFFLYFFSYRSLSYEALLPGQRSIGHSMQFS